MNRLDPFNDGSQIAYYPFEDSIVDVVGGYNATSVVNAGYDMGVFGQGLSMSGNGYADVSTHPFTLNTLRTVAVWVKINGNGGTAANQSNSLFTVGIYNSYA